MLTKSSSKMTENENLFVPSSMGYDHEMVPKTKDWVERLNLDSRLPNFNTERILVPKSQAGASPSSEVMPLTFQPYSPKKRLGLGTIIVTETEPTTPSVPTEVKDTEQESEINELTKLFQMLIDEKNTSSSKSLRLKPIQKPQLKCELCHYTNHLTDDCYRILYYIICKREDHGTLDHEMYTASLKRSENYKAQPYQYASPSKQILKAKAKPIPPCTHCSFNDTYLMTVETTLSVKFVEVMITLPQDTIVSFISEEEYMTENENDVKVKQITTDNGTEFRNHGVAKKMNRTLIDVARTMLNRLVLSKHFWTEADHLGKFDAKADDGYFLGYSFVSKAFRVFNTRRQQVEKTYHVIFDESMKAIRFTNTSVDEIVIDDSSRYPLDEYLHEDAPSRQYHPDIPLTEDNEGLPDLINTEGTHEQNAQNEQIITQPTEGPSGNNTEVSVFINESLVPDVL
ncbi:retrovirus-related pol polyprotein from transposon TNT 1-94 [Tanacetum coccineum]